MGQYSDTVSTLFPGANVQQTAEQASQLGQPVDIGEEQKAKLDPGSAARMRTTAPDQAAQAQKLAGETGLPAPVVARNLPELQAQASINKYAQFIDSNPQVASLGPDFHEVAHDDVSALERTGLYAKNLYAGVVNLGGGVLGGFRALEDSFHVADNVLRGASDALLGTHFGGVDESMPAAAARFFSYGQKYLQDYANEITDSNNKLGNTEQAVMSGVQSLAQNAPLLLAGLVTRNPYVALDAMGAITFGQTYGQARDAGKGIGTSLAYGAFNGAVEKYTEMLPVGKLFGDLAENTGFVKLITHQLITEIPGEQVATILQDFSEFVTLHPEQTINDYLAARPEAAYQTLVATVVATAAQGTAVHTLAHMTGTQAKMAEDRAKMLKELGSAAEASKLRERSPEQFKRYMEQVAPDTDIYIDAADLQDALKQSSFEDNGIMLPDDINERIAEAADNDVPVKLSAAEYATYFADSHTAQFLSEKARVGRPDAMNAEEAKNIDSEFKARAERVLTESDNAAELRRQAADINDQVKSQIVATGRFRGDVANAYASMVENFFVTMADRAGTTPADLFAKYPLRIQASDQVVEQPSDVNQLPAEAFTTDRAVNYGTPGEMSVIVRNPATGKRAGFMDMEHKGDSQLQIKLVQVDSSLRGQGIGQQLIERAYAEAQKQGRTLVSDRAVSAQQLRAYEALRRKGWIIRYTNPEEVQRVLEQADAFQRQGEDIAALGASVGIGESVVRQIAPPPAAASLNQAKLQPVAQLASETGPLPKGHTRFRHFGNFIVPELNPQFMGTGMRGEEAKRAGPRVTSLYPDKGFQKESGVGPIEYTVDIPNSQLYDANKDPQGFMQLASEPTSLVIGDNGKLVPAPGSEQRIDWDHFEQLVKDAGFAGYTVPKGEGNMRGQARVFNAIPVVGARTESLFQLAPGTEPEGWEAVAQHLTPEERADVNKRSAAKLVTVFDSIPAAEDYAAAAEAGKAAKGWYERATQALRQVFGDTDAPRFAGLLAAMSPQTSVELNLENAVIVWDAWHKAGRPTEGDKIVEAMKAGMKPRQLLPAWLDNAVRALSAENPTEIKLSGQKVSAFMKNLSGNVNEVTNDTWMRRFALFGVGTHLDRGKRYEAMSARVREAAKLLTERTGQEWTPPQVQETVWSFIKTAYELADAAGETRSIEELVKDGVITDKLIGGVPKLDELLRSSATVKTILEKAGYGEQLKALEDAGLVSSDTGLANSAPRLLTIARNLDERRAEDAAKQAGGGTLEQGGRLEGLPASSPGPIPVVQDAARLYLEASGIKPAFPPQRRYASVDVARAERIAQAYENASHDPHNEQVQAAYAALIAETLAQYQAIKKLGIKIELIPPGENPYKSGPKEVLADLARGHLWTFPTDQGFGQQEAPDHPLLTPTAEKIGDHVLLANDVFRIVHDVFGHGLEGVGFGPIGEENAFQAHVRMYSPLAARAMTTETRGQNSWVNFGPHGEANRANQQQTRYAEQKATLLPEWVTTEGVAETGTLGQPARGAITLGRDLQAGSTVKLFEAADLSTFLHESGHFFFEVMADIAARPNAPAGIQADMQKLLDWVGFKGTLQEWRALDVPQRRDAHEQFARGFESWLLEGSAPNEQMRSLFHRFRAWLVNIYKRASALNVTLTDEVRDVMKRMLAVQEQIEAAEAVRQYAPLFDNQAASGMTPEEWTRYQETAAAATQQAEDQLQARSMRNLRWLDNARSRELSKLQKENAAKVAAVRSEVEQEMDQQPERIAERLLTTGVTYVPNLVDGTPEEVTVENHKLSIPSLAESYGTREEHKAIAEAAGLDPKTVRAPWQELPRRYLAKEGMTADEVGELVGMSGDKLVQTLLTMEPREQVVQRETERRVMEKYGDLNNEQMLARAVDQAVHNRLRMRVVSAELAALDASMKASPGGVEAVRSAAREAAENVIQRRKVRDIKPGAFNTAEARAARESGNALAKGDLKLAATRKRDQLFNGFAARSASRAMDYIEKNLRYLQKFNTDATRRALDPAYRDQIDKLLERFDLRPRSLAQVDKRTALHAWIKSQEEDGVEPIIPDELRDEARRMNYQNLTLEQFQGLVDSVKNIEHLGRMKRRLLVAKEQRDFDTAADSVVASIDENAPKGRNKERLEKDLSLWGRVSDTVSEWLTHLRKFASIARQIDGGKDGGQMWEYFIRPLNAASDAEVAMRAAATKRLHSLIESVPTLKNSFLQKIGRRVAGPAKLFIPEINESLSTEARIAVALNWGNEGNRERIMEGNRWTASQAQAVINTLTKEELDFVQGVFDFIGEYWPKIAAKEERVTGVRPGRVEPTPIDTQHGRYAGGYYPIVADAMRSERASQQNDAELIGQALRGSVTRATTRRGHTKERVGGKDPVRLDLGVITHHVSQVIHDLSWHEALIDTSRMLRDSRVSGALRAHYGAETTRLMRRTLDDSARGEVIAKDAGERLVNYFRVGTTIGGLGFSLTTALLQPAGFAQSAVRIGYGNLARGLIQFTARPVQTTKDVWEQSEFMRERSRLMNRELGEITNRLDKGGRTLASFYFLPIQAMQTAVDVPTWLGAYNKAVNEGEKHERAVSLADQAVRDSQSTGAIHDLAEAQRGGAWKKLWTNFYSYFSATYQLTAESGAKFRSKPNPATAAKLAADMFALYAVPAAIGLILRQGLRGDWKDKDEEALLEAWLKETLSNVLGVFPFVGRELVGAIQGYDYQGPAGASIIAQTGQVIKQLEQGDVDEALLRAANRAAGTAFHYPAAQVDRTVRGFIAASEGKAGPQALIVGPPPKEKK